MFNQIFDAIEEWMRELLTGMISSNLDRMFTDVNQKTSEIAGQVGQTPQGWNGSIFSMIEGLSNSVIMPIAGIIITFVLCYELISMLTERNNMHDIDTWMFFISHRNLLLSALFSHSVVCEILRYSLPEAIILLPSYVLQTW